MRTTIRLAVGLLLSTAVLTLALAPVAHAGSVLPIPDRVAIGTWPTPDQPPYALWASQPLVARFLTAPIYVAR